MKRLTRYWRKRWLRYVEGDRSLEPEVNRTHHLHSLVGLDPELLAEPLKDTPKSPQKLPKVRKRFRSIVAERPRFKVSQRPDSAALGPAL